MSHSTAKASYDLIIALIEKGDLCEAQKAFDEMAGLGDHKDDAFLRAKAFAIIYAYGKYASYLENAQKAFDDRVATLGDNEDDAIEHARASVALLSAYKDYDSDRHEENVNKAFDDMKALFGGKNWRSRDCDLGYASYSISLLSAYGNYVRHMENAQKVFDAMATLGDNEEIALERAKASLDLMMVYMEPVIQEINDLNKAQRSFRRILSERRFSGEKNIDQIELAKLHDEEFGTKCATLSVDLVSAYANYARQVEKTQKVFDAMASLGNSEEIAILRAKASFNLMIDYSNAGDLQKVQAIFDGMAALGDHEEIVECRTKAQKMLDDLMEKSVDREKNRD